MKKLALYLLVFISTSSALAQQEKKVESTISEITVFLNKAQITRKVKAKIESGKTNLILAGLTALPDQQSLQVSGKGSFIILGTALQQNFLTEQPVPKAVQILKDSIEYLQRQVNLENSQKEILNKEEQMLLANLKIGGNNQNLTAAELKAMADFFRTRLTDIVITRARHDERIGKLNDRINRIHLQISEKTNLYSRNTNEIVISLSATEPTSVDLEVNYVVPNAGWFPVYDLRAANTKGSVQLSYKANVFQNTGEEWNNVKLKLSTANPALGGLKPELNPWYLDFYQSVARANRYRSSALKKDKSAPAAYGPVSEVAAEEDAESVSDYVSTIETTLNTEFEIGLPYTVSSSNKPTLVDIRNHELKAEYVYSTAPKLDKDAFLMARATGWEDFNLLPGEANIFFEGTFVGKTFIDPNSIRDTLSISMGRDTRIVVKREKLKDLSSKKLIGTNRRASYAFEISVRNTKNETVKITIEDQVPVSRNSQIEVTMLDQGGAAYNSATGKLTWELTIAANETKKVVYKYEVKYPKDRAIAGLE